MVGKDQQVEIVCTECLQRFWVRKPKAFSSNDQLSFLGFPKHKCPKCNKTLWYPLRGDYLGCYAIALLFFGLVTIAGLLLGRVGIPGLLAVGGAIALVSNAAIKRKIAKADEMSRLQAGDEGQN